MRVRKGKENVKNVSAVGRERARPLPQSIFVQANKVDANIEAESLEGSADEEGGGGENTAPFQNDDDNFALRSAIENYFISTGGLKRKTKSKREKDDLKIDQKSKEGSDAHVECDIVKLIEWTKIADNYIPPSGASPSASFDQWMTYLNAGFNLIIYGIGSKCELLNDFCKEKLSDFTHVIVDGFFSSVNARIVLQCLEEAHSLSCRCKGDSLVEWAESILTELKKKNKDVIIVINNIDGPGMREESQQRVISKLAASPQVRLVASVDHFNAPLLWNREEASSLNAVYLHVCTMRAYGAELLASESALLGLSVRTSQRRHTVSSLTAIWQSLTANSRSLFVILTKLFFGQKQPLEFFALFRRAREEFLVSSDIAMRRQLVEFVDHHLVNLKTKKDGNEYIEVLVDEKLLVGFLEEKGMLTSVDDEKEDDSD